MAVMVDVATKVCVVVLGLCLLGFIWWIVSSANHERRRTRAEAWARAQAARSAVAAASTELDDDQAEADTFPVPLPRDGRHHASPGDWAEALTVPMLLAREAMEVDPPVVRPYMREDVVPIVRPYMQDDFPTREISVFHGDTPVWTAPPA